MMVRLFAALLVLASACSPAFAVDIGRISSNLALATMSDAELAQNGLKRVKIGDLTLPDGRLAAADPLVMPEREPFSRTVPPGTYPAEAIALAGLDPRNAALILRFSQAKPVTWELGLLPGQDSGTLKTDEFFGIPVDAGTAAFMSSSFYKASEERLDQIRRKKPGSNPNYYDDVLAAEYTGATNSLRHQPLPDRPGAAAIIASSGWGDGYYPVLFGLGADGKPVLAMIDFYVAENAAISPAPNPLTGEPQTGSLDAAVLKIVTEAVAKWSLLLACTKDNARLNERLESAWSQERSEIAWLFGEALLTIESRKTISDMTDPARMVASLGTTEQREARCKADGSWQELAAGTHQSNPSLEIIRLLSNR
jgi:Protein of unknown function (DUF4241)